MLLLPETIVPVDPKPTVESTVMTDEPTDTALIAFTLG